MAALAIFGCDSATPPAAETTVQVAVAPDPDACSGLAVLAALQAQAGDTSPEGSAPRLDNVTAVDRDGALDATVCSARLTFAGPAGETSTPIRYTVQAGGRVVNLLSGPANLAQAPVAPPVEAPAPIQSPAVIAAIPPAPMPSPTTTPRLAAKVAGPAARDIGIEPRLSARGRPSFDCSAASGRAEQLICGDERLAALDRVAAGLYDQALSRTGRRTRDILRDTQDAFIIGRDRCRSGACIAQSYQTRLDELDQILADR